MARPKKEGLEYFPHDVDLSSDEKIEALEAHYGLVGYAVYLKLLERIYRAGGYLHLTDDLVLVLAKKYGITENDLNGIISVSVQQKLFYFKNGPKGRVVTSKGISKRIKAVEAKRAEWREKKENKKFSPEKTQGKPEENATKESKGNKSKGNEIKEKSVGFNNTSEDNLSLVAETEPPYEKNKPTPPTSQEREEPGRKKFYGEFRNVELAEKEYKHLTDLYGENRVTAYIIKLSMHIKSKGKKYADHYATLREWFLEDKVEPFKICTSTEPMPKEETAQHRWKHPDLKDGKDPKTELPIIFCMHCKKITAWPQRT